MGFATPRPSPHHRSFSSIESSMCESPPLKQPRLFTPPPLSPSTKQLATPLNFELSPTPQKPPRPFRDSTNQTRSSDVMACSPPQIERLKLFDFPATPQTLARDAGVLPKESILSRSVYFWNSIFSTVNYDVIIVSRVRKSGRVTRSGPELRRKQSRGTNINPFTPKEYHTAARKRIQQA